MNGDDAASDAAAAAVPPDAVAPAVPRGAIAALAAAAFASGASLRVNDALLPLLAREFDVALGTAAQVVGAFAVAYGCAQLAFGPLGDRHGKVRVVAWATAASAVAALACALAPGFDTLRIARAIAGATAAALIPLSMAWIGDVVPYERRQPVLARFLIGQITGLAAGVWIGGIAADALSWRAPYLLLAVLFGVVAAVLFTLHRRLPAHTRATTPRRGPLLRGIAAEFADVLSRRWARTVLALVFLEGACVYGPFAFIASHLHRAHGLTLSAAGAIVMAFGAGGFAFAVASPRLIATLGEAGLARAGGVLMAAGMLAIGYAPAWGAALAGCLALGLGFYMLHNTLQVNATQMAPERRGAAVSAFAACFFLGQSVGVTVGGWTVGGAGTAPLLAAGAAGVASVACAFVVLRERWRSQH